tara:strand:- start:877 stop:1134 length:258 start_codon:yes stop_codon:yes gene_type:complete
MQTEEIISMKKIALFAALPAALAISACAESPQEEQADQIEESADARADEIDAMAEDMPTEAQEDAMEDRADAVDEAGDEMADNME